MFVWRHSYLSCEFLGFGRNFTATSCSGCNLNSLRATTLFKQPKFSLGDISVVFVSHYFTNPSYCSINQSEFCGPQRPQKWTNWGLYSRRSFSGTPNPTPSSVFSPNSISPLQPPHLYTPATQANFWTEGQTNGRRSEVRERTAQPSNQSATSKRTKEQTNEPSKRKRGNEQTNGTPDEQTIPMHKFKSTLACHHQKFNRLQVYFSISWLPFTVIYLFHPFLLFLLDFP